MSVRGKLVQLESGGHIAYDEYGDSAGVPVLFYHGWPSSRSMAELTDEAARELGVRIISPDRPGIRDSAFQRDRQLTDWPPVMCQLADALAIESFRVLAISGGAPYAYVTGWAMPGRVEAMAVVSGAPPIAELSDRSGLLRLYRWMLAIREVQPELLHVLFRIARPFAAVRMPLRFRPFLLMALQRLDADVLRDKRAFDACFESSRAAWSASIEGVISDAEIYATRWGFPLEEVRTPVRLWHGTKDRTFDYRLAEEIAARLPNCELRIVENAGHYSLPIRNMSLILADLMAVRAERR